MIEIIAITIVIIVISLFLLLDYIRNNRHSSINNSSFYHPRNQPSDLSFRKSSDEKSTASAEDKQSEFDAIVQSIMKGFHPDSIKDEEECEKQLIQFLNKKFPNKILRRGHTSRGVKIDLVIEGSYALELIVVDNEGRLISLMDQMLKSKQDFGKLAAILVDINKIPVSKIEEYVTELEKIGIKTILKKVY